MEELSTKYLIKHKQIDMKALENIVLPIIIICVMSLSSCKDIEPAPDVIDAQQEMIEALTKSWTITSATLDNATVTSNWDNFNIQLTSSLGYSTNSSTNEQKLVWPVSGTYTFPESNNPNKILRSDGVEITLVSVTESSATLSFQITGRNGRTDGLLGEWVFVMGN